ncbi:MAG: hypothetical protein ACJ704_03150 [Nitrososphaeraceae archaeon]
MALDTILEKDLIGSSAKSKSPAAPLLIVPKQLIILCEDRFLKYSEIFPTKDREFAYL